MFGGQMFGAGMYGQTDCCCAVVPPVTPPSGGGPDGMRWRIQQDEYDRRRDDEDVALITSILLG